MISDEGGDGIHYIGYVWFHKWQLYTGLLLRISWGWYKFCRNGALTVCRIFTRTNIWCFQWDSPGAINLLKMIWAHFLSRGITDCQVSYDMTVRTGWKHFKLSDWHNCWGAEGTWGMNLRNSLNTQPRLDVGWREDSAPILILHQLCAFICVTFLDRRVDICLDLCRSCDGDPLTTQDFHLAKLRLHSVVEIEQVH